MVKLKYNNKIWSNQITINSCSNFFFKFVLFNEKDPSDKKFKYEEPANRFVNLKLFDNPKNIVLKCKWEINIIKFCLFYDITDQEGRMFINGSHSSMGEWTKNPKVDMNYGNERMDTGSGWNK